MPTPGEKLKEQAEQTIEQKNIESNAEKQSIMTMFFDHVLNKTDATTKMHCNVESDPLDGILTVRCNKANPPQNARPSNTPKD